MARKSKAAILEDIHSEAIKRFDAILVREKLDRNLAVEDLVFANDHDGQWDDQAKTKRKDRPRYTINRVAPAIDQVVGDQKQNKVAIKVRPVSKDAESGVAKIYEGVIRNIENQSHATNAYDTAFEEAVTCGYGGWRLTTEYADDSTFDQDISIRPIKSAATSLFFGMHEQYDARDATHAFYTSFISKEDFKEKYPNSTVTDFSSQEFVRNTDWIREDEIRIAEYWVKTPITKRIALMSDGKTLDLEDEREVIDDLLFQGIEIVKERSVKSHKVEMYIMSGAEILKGPMNWSGKYIPLVPLYGRIAHIEGRTTIRGLVRFAKDACRIYNYAVSANIEVTALAPKDPYWITDIMIGENKRQFETFAEKNPPFMVFNPDERVGNQPPTRTGAPSVQTGLLQILQQASQDVHTTTGLHAPSMGNGSSLLSEKAIMSQAEKGDRGVYVFTDNLIKSIEYTGDMLIDLIPRIYDTERLVTILGDDGTADVIKINQQAFDEFNQTVIDESTGQPVIVNDISRGRYDVVAVSGPAFSTQKREALEQLVELAGASEEFASVSGDLIASSLDILEADEIKKRMRRIYIQKGIATPTEEEIEEMGLNQPEEPNQEQQALLQNIESETMKNAAEIESKQIENEKKRAETMKILAEAESQALENDLVESGLIDLLR
jgi:hypothetical protein